MGTEYTAVSKTVVGRVFVLLCVRVFATFRLLSYSSTYGCACCTAVVLILGENLTFFVSVCRCTDDAAALRCCTPLAVLGDQSGLFMEQQ